MNLEELLKQGKIAEFNKARPLRGKLELFAADLSGVDLRGADLSKANLEKADLSGVNLSGVNLAGANLSGVDLTDANLVEAMAMKTRWRDAYVSNADLTGIELAQADLTGAEFDNCNFNTANLTSARFNQAAFVGCTFREAELSECRMSDTQLQGADLTGVYGGQAHFSRSDLTGAILIGADLTGAKLANTVLKDADLSLVKLRNANLTGADFSGAVLDQTDLTRADLTEAVTDEADFSSAILTEAQLDGALGEERRAKVPDAAQLLIEEPTLAVSGKHIAVLWENPEPGSPRLRLAISAMSGSPKTPPQAIPVPLDLVLAKTLCGTSEGFAVALLVERPSGISVMLSRWGFDGQRLGARTVRLGYTPLVRPIVREENGELMIYGISREGPGLILQQLTDEGLKAVDGEGMSTVRGFVSELHPVVLSKGGVVTVMQRRGQSQPMRAPSGFPGRSSASTLVADGQVAMVWAERSRTGLHTAMLAPNEPPDEQRLLPKKIVGTVSAGSHGGVGWAAFTIEATTPDEPTTAWAVRLDGGAPIAVTAGGEDDVDLVRVVEGGGSLLVAVTTLDGALKLFSINKSAKKVWSLS
ncbi:MAG: hypothetical protein ACI8S6_003860 [Myxococcota bacterium]|jgi:uncharacterized protein YjbI with pentapeptide repeats